MKIDANARRQGSAEQILARSATSEDPGQDSGRISPTDDRGVRKKGDFFTLCLMFQSQFQTVAGVISVVGTVFLTS